MLQNENASRAEPKASVSFVLWPQRQFFYTPTPYVLPEDKDHKFL